MSDILVKASNNIIHVQFNRLQKKNAITSAMYGQMADAIEQAEADTSIRAMIFSGSEGCFTAGNDLHDFMASNASGSFTTDMPVIRFLKALITSSVPIVAAVDGLAIGVGTTMLLHMDHVVLSKNSMLKMPFTDLALVPEAASSYVLPQMLGYARAADLLLSGNAMSGETAVDWGIGGYLVDDYKAVQQKASELAEAYNNRPPTAIRKSKKLLKGDQTAMMQQFNLELKDFAAQLMSDECREAVTAFMQGRDPDWSKFG